MNVNKATTRDKKRFKRKHGHTVSNRSIFTIVSIQVQKAEEAKESKHGNSD